MIQFPRYLPKEIIPPEDLRSWREGLKKTESTNCPSEVRQFIEAVADQLPAFSQIGEDKVGITGYELKLAGMTQFKGEFIIDSILYELPVPRMKAVDHYNAMHRSFNRKGKQGLIDYCRAHCKASSLDHLLQILNVQVFQEESPEFKKVMNEIKKAA